MLKGFLVILNGDCRKDLKGIYTEFIPTRNKQKAIDYSNGNGDIIGCVPYEVNLELLNKDEKSLILDRIAFLGEL